MCVCVYICTCVYMYIYIYMYVFVCVRRYSKHAQVCVWIANSYIYIYTCIHTCIYVHMYVCIYIYILYVDIQNIHQFVYGPHTLRLNPMPHVPPPPHRWDTELCNKNVQVAYMCMYICIHAYICVQYVSLQ